MSRRSRTRGYHDRVAVVTGAASGIGRALARELARCGSDVLLADIAAEAVREAARAIVADGGRAEAVVVDVADAAAVTEMVDTVVRTRGRIDFLFNNAGTAVGGEALSHTLADWRRCVDVNLMGAVHGFYAAYPHMQKARSGTIANTGSMAGLFPVPGVPAYCATKSGVVALSRVMRMEAAAYGVTVVAICPGVVDTPIIQNVAHGIVKGDLPTGEIRRQVKRMHPMPPERFAAKALDAVLRRKCVALIPGWWSVLWWLDRVAPWTTDWYGAWVYRRVAVKMLGRKL
jgi:NAD(P)-dependent dehydrogenase (short-subunit alcohol dehydrogenase family)